MTKTCSSCGETLERAAFHVDRRSADGLRGRCKACVLAAQRAYYSENRESELERNRRWHRENPELARAKTRRWRAKTKGDLDAAE